MAVNNEIGTIQPIKVGEILKDYQTFTLLVDAGRAVGKRIR